jgi:ribonuclease-3
MCILFTPCCSCVQLALTHPSYDLKYGTTSDHVRNSLTNCGIKRPQVMFERSQLQGKSSEQVNTESSTMQPLHNERLEFLGDAIIEYLTTTHLFHMFPKHTEGQLSSHRMALVQNSNLCCVAKRLRLQDYLLIQHESDLSNDILDHELANCFEALIGSIYQDGGLEACDCVLGGALFTEEPLRMVWNSFPPHPLQCEHLDGDRFMIEQSEHLQKLTLLEEAIGVQFRNVRILAKAFTHSSIENNDITRGHNQRLEFFGDAILQFVTSCHLYNAYPQHHEGRLTLMRSSIVSNDTLSKVASSLGLQEYVLVDDKQNVPINGKLLADLTEALSAAILLDKGLPYVWTFCQVCLLPNLKPPGQEDQVPQVTPTDPKSQLLRKLIQEQRRKGLSRELPFYRVIGRKGPSHNPVFTAGVYCGGRLLAKGDGRSINSAEQKAAQKATTHLEEKR